MRSLEEAGTGPQTISSVIGILIDKLERGGKEDNKAERDIMGNKNKEYEQI